MAFDENMPVDVQETLDVAAILQVTEFQIFHLAYSRWFGASPSREMLEPIFADYMFRELVPPWVRQFTRYVLDLYEAGKLELDMFGISKVQVTDEMVSKGVRYSISIVLALATLMVLVFSSKPLLAMLQNCYFPPCY